MEEIHEYSSTSSYPLPCGHDEVFPLENRNTDDYAILSKPCPDRLPQGHQEKAEELKRYHKYMFLLRLLNKASITIPTGITI